jgi:glycosidase
MPMSPKYPLIYEINTWVWLSSLREKFGADINLGSIPASVWDSIAEYGFDAVWLMGVWERSPFGISIASRSRNMVDQFRKALPDFVSSDIVGSPYCVRRYVVDNHLGGPKGLAIARNELAVRGIRLILDFVPNHVAADHPWVEEHPDYFIAASSRDSARDPSSYIKAGSNIFACGRDPSFPVWPDVLQLNAFCEGVRKAAVETLNEIARQCDGVRCDMAMLMLNDTFEYTWGSRAGKRPQTDYWFDVIPGVRDQHPSFVFIAEAYWDREWELQQQGFDFCYDKRLYDRLKDVNAKSIRLHLGADLDYQNRLLRFIENHDESRAAAVFDPAKERAAALALTTLPGAKLFQEGQFEGRKVKLPVFLGRQPREAVDRGLQAFYKQLLGRSGSSIFRDGDWVMCKCSGWPDNPSWQNFLAWTWQTRGERCMIVLNFSSNASQGRIQLPWNNLKGQTWRLADTFSDVSYERAGDELVNPGLYVDLGPWAYNCFSLRRLAVVTPIEAEVDRPAAA